MNITTIQSRIKSRYRGTPDPRKARSISLQLIGSGFLSICLVQHGQISWDSLFFTPTLQAYYDIYYFLYSMIFSHFEHRRNVISVKVFGCDRFTFLMVMMFMMVSYPINSSFHFICLSFYLLAKIISFFLKLLKPNFHW